MNHLTPQCDRYALTQALRDNPFRGRTPAKGRGVCRLRDQRRTCRLAYRPAEMCWSVLARQSLSAAICDARPGDGGLLDSRPVYTALGGA